MACIRQRGYYYPRRTSLSKTKVVQEQVTYNATLALVTGPLKSLVKKSNGSCT